MTKMTTVTDTPQPETRATVEAVLAAHSALGRFQIGIYRHTVRVRKLHASTGFMTGRLCVDPSVGGCFLRHSIARSAAIWNPCGQAK